MRFIEKCRQIIAAILIIVGIAAIVFFGVRTGNMQSSFEKPDTFNGTAMGTVIKKTIYSLDSEESEWINQKIDQCLEDLENQISVRVTDSEVSKCNRNYEVDCIYNLSQDLIAYLNREIEIYQETEGAFSPCIRPIADLWKIEDGVSALPSENAIKVTLESTNVSDLEIKENGIIFHKEQMAIDFGAVGKGIACDKIVEELAKSDIQGAVISVGGSIAVYGRKTDKKEWNIGIQNPRGQDGDILGVLTLSGSKMIATSGDYEKYFESGGKRYHHIFDPQTGYPADNGLISVTIISDNGFLSDALSTACFVLGLEKGMAYAKEKGVEAIFVTEEKKVYLTNGLKTDFMVQAEGYQLIEDGM